MVTVKQQGYSAAIAINWGSDLTAQKRKSRKNQLKNWKKQETKLVEVSLKKKDGLKKKTIHDGKGTKLSYWAEKLVYDKMKDHLRKKIPVTGKMIKKWGLQAAKQSNVKVKLGDKWLRLWCERWSVSIQVK